MRLPLPINSAGWKKREERTNRKEQESALSFIPLIMLPNHSIKRALSAHSKHSEKRGRDEHVVCAVSTSGAVQKTGQGELSHETEKGPFVCNGLKACYSVARRHFTTN